MPKKSRNNKAKGANAANGAMLQKMMQMMATVQLQSKSAPKPRKRRNRGSRANAVNAEGMITLSRKELLATIKADAAGNAIGTYNIKPSTFTFLKNLGSSFERSRWLKVAVSYKPAVSMTSAGLLAMGVDWDGASVARTRENIAAYTPSSTFAIWQDTEKNPMVLPPARLQSRQWYSHQSSEAQEWGPGSIAVAATGPESATLGEVYVSYTIQMMGTRN